MPKQPTLEENFEKLDDIIEEMKAEDISLDESFKKYEEGIKIIKKCHDAIDRVEKKFTVIEDI